MKNLNLYLVTAVAAGLSFSCVSDDDTALAPFSEVVYSENFQEAVDGTDLDIAGWTNFAQAGTKLWKEERFTDNGIENGYAEFSSFGTNQSSNIGWLITPALNLDGAAKKFSFQAAQHHLSSVNNTLQILISTNYNGSDVMAATWTPLQAIVPTQANDWYEFVNSGAIDLSAYSGTVHIAFKVTGNGSTLTAGYQIDNVKLF